MYPEGTRIELIAMNMEKQPVDAGTKGTVSGIDDIGTLHVNWDNGSTLGIIIGVDDFRTINDDKKGGN